MKKFDLVKSQLVIDERTRDNDNLLLSKIWYREFKIIDNTNDLVNFFIALSDNKLSSAESIRRCRQKVQEIHPELRGESYLSRKKIKYQKLFE